MSSSPAWLPIESNPEVMNKFLHSLGLDKAWNITDVFGLDPELLEMIPKPVVSLLLLFPLTPECMPFYTDRAHQACKEDQIVSKDLYYMWQTIGNACGTVAMIHAVANNLDTLKLDDGFLKEFLDATKDLSPEDRSRKLENSQSIGEVHDVVAREGQTAAPCLNDKVDYHFVAFVEKDGHLYELDGRKKSPLNCGPCTKESFLMDAAGQCKKYMESDPANINFTVLALTGGQVD